MSTDERHLPQREERGPTWLRRTRYRCSCGYASGWRAYPGHAEQAWRAHRNAREASQ
jgi:hypothetical protein